MIEECGPGCICSNCISEDDYLDLLSKQNLKELTISSRTEYSDLSRQTSCLQIDPRLKKQSQRNDILDLNFEPIQRDKSYVIFHYYMFYSDVNYMKLFCMDLENLLNNKQNVDSTIAKIQTKQVVCKTIQFLGAFRPQQIELLFLDYFIPQPSSTVDKLNQLDKTKMDQDSLKNTARELMYFQTNCGITSLSQAKQYVAAYMKIAGSNMRQLQCNKLLFGQKKNQVRKVYTSGIEHLKNTFTNLYDRLYCRAELMVKEELEDYRIFIIRGLCFTLTNICNYVFDFERFVEDKKLLSQDELSLSNLKSRFKSMSNSEQFFRIVLNSGTTLDQTIEYLLDLFEPGF